MAWSKPAMYGLIVIVTSSFLTAAAFEVALRLYHGKLLDFTSITHGPTTGGIAQYDPLLGWVPRPGHFSRTGWSWNVDGAALRANGPSGPSGPRPIVAVGDSFTFGDEVDDHQTWPAQLQMLLQHRVLNGGVFAYGLDQAYLRAVKLLDTHSPAVIIVAFISNNINRMELSYYQGRWKPYFAYGATGLELRNVPVPRERAVSRPLPALNRALGYSYLANAVLTRTPAGSWYAGPGQITEHAEGERVGVDLLTRLNELGRARGVRVVVVTLATDGRIGGNRRLPTVVARLRQNGVQVADLASEMLELPAEEFARRFRGKGHYGPELNAWVARRLAHLISPLGANDPILVHR